MTQTPQVGRSSRTFSGGHWTAVPQLLCLVLGLLRWQPQPPDPCWHTSWQPAGMEAQNGPYGAARLATAMPAAYLWRQLSGCVRRWCAVPPSAPMSHPHLHPPAPP